MKENKEEKQKNETVSAAHQRICIVKFHSTNAIRHQNVLLMPITLNQLFPFIHRMYSASATQIFGFFVVVAALCRIYGVKNVHRVSLSDFNVLRIIHILFNVNLLFGSCFFFRLFCFSFNFGFFFRWSIRIAVLTRNL